MKTFIYYHHDCPDGFGAAFCFWLKYKDQAEYIPLKHNGDVKSQIIPYNKGDRIYFCDFSPSRDLYLEMIKEADVIVLDHHLTAKNNIGDLVPIDMNESGASLAWNYNFPNQPQPLMIRLLRDQDLWKWEIKNSRLLFNLIDNCDYSFEKWEKVMESLSYDNQEVCIGKHDLLLNKAESLEDMRRKHVNAIVKKRHMINIDGINFMACNSPIFISEIGEELVRLGYDVGAIYFSEGNGWRVSLRSVKVDVQEVARKFGGGGHKNSAAFITKKLTIGGENDEVENKGNK